MAHKSRSGEGRVVLINGHMLSAPQRQALIHLETFLRHNGGDSFAGSVSAKGDGRWIDLKDVFPGKTGPRRCIYTLHGLGVLAARNIARVEGRCKLVPQSDVFAVENLCELALRRSVADEN
jgi:hypothetical protein